MITTMTTSFTRSGSYPLLTKTFTRTPTGWDKADYDGAYLFHATDFEVNDLTGLADLLTMLASDPHSCIIRGEPTGETRDIRRTLYDDDKSVATLRARANGQAWVMLDFDAVPVSDEGYTTNEDRLAHLIAMLPACFHDVSFYYQWSASAGTAGWDALSCHLWFWLDQPWLCRTMYERFATGDFASAGVDPSPFTPNQIHYTAAPIFRGAPDPLGAQRYGLVRFAKDAVTLPMWTRPVAPKPTLTALQHNHLFPNKRFIELLGEIGPGYHAEIRKAIAHYCSVTAPNDFDRTYLVNSLENAIHMAVPGKSKKSNYLNAAYLNRLVDGAQRKFGRII